MRYMYIDYLLILNSHGFQHAIGCSVPKHIEEGMGLYFMLFIVSILPGNITWRTKNY